MSFIYGPRPVVHINEDGTRTVLSSAAVSDPIEATPDDQPVQEYIDKLPKGVIKIGDHELPIFGFKLNSDDDGGAA